MKYLFLALPLFLLGACKTQNVTNQSDKTVVKKEGACPENGTCNVLVHKNSSLTLMTDDTGALYPEIGFGDDFVIEFTYDIKGPEGTADGNYSETIHFVIPKNTEVLSLKDKGLSEVQMVWGMHCFCPDAGYHPVQKGSLKINKSDNQATFDIQLSVAGKNPKINHIVRKVRL